MSIWYRHPRLYDLGMRLIHGKHYTERYEYLSSLIQEGSSLLDIGCGSCLLYEYLRKKSVQYQGWDLNSYFVKVAQKKGLNVKLQDCVTAKIPSVDYIIVSDVLHHIAKRDRGLVRSCFKQAKKALIIVEPFADPVKATRRVYRFLREMRRKVGFIEALIGENDGSNAPHDILIRPKQDLIRYLDSYGKNKKHIIGDELFALYPKRPKH